MPSDQNQNTKWSFWVDRGGTFTDIIAVSPDGSTLPLKLLSENQALYEDATIHAIRTTLNVQSDNSIPNELIDEIKIGTTVATNALLEKKGEPTLLITTRGFKDALEIGNQARPDIFALKIKKPEMLYSASAEISERILSDGQIDIPLDKNEARDILSNYFGQGLRSVAVLFMHSYKFPDHEKTVGQIAKEIGFKEITLSHEASPLIKLIPRGDTAVVDAYLTPILKGYTNKIAETLGIETNDIDLKFMSSSGGLMSREVFRGKDAILSGPAGGVIGAKKTAAEEGIEKIISFDMGGTSTDVSQCAKEIDIRFETEIAGCRLQSPMLHIETVAAGGGSILTYSHGRMAVGPTSAGANPGPKCYRRNGPLTVTDANLMSGRLIPEYFPSIFGTNQNESLDKMSVKQAFSERAKEIGGDLTPEQCAEGYIAIANEIMAAAIKKISVARGIDLKDYTLVAFGGAGGQHAANIADRLNISKIFIPAHSGLLSAVGIGLADETWRKSKMVAATFSKEEVKRLQQTKSELVSEAALSLGDTNSNQLLSKNLKTECFCYICYEGTDTKLAITLSDAAAMQSEFEAKHLQQFGFLQKDTPLIIEQIEVTQSIIAPHPVKPKATKPSKTRPISEEAKLVFEAGQWLTAEIHLEENLKPGNFIEGTSLIVAAHQTIYVPKGWSLQKSSSGHLTMEKPNTNKQRTTAIQLETRDPIRLELFNNLFMSIAEQMGEALRGAARSVNIKERLDFSCALFNAMGDLIANAPHMPVHLGSMDSAVKSIIDANPDGFEVGDAFMTNAPYNGGTHLPDITVVTPVFDQNGVIAFVAARGHHADIGGITPGSMSPNAVNINEEGVLIDNFKLVEKGQFQEEKVLSILCDHAHPARNPEQNCADLKAQLAATAKGVKEINSLISNYGAETLNQYMAYSIAQAENAVRSLVNTLEPSEFSCQMDGGLQVSVKITPNYETRSLTIDFSGTSPEAANNFNAPQPVTRAAVLYVIRTLIRQNIPMNAGCLKPVKIILPEKSILKPEYPAAVVAGNVETSQVVTNCLYGAFGVLGMAQGTMNNLTFGNETYQYYETICSGSPAGDGFDGTPAVHTHMTNSRLTDPEILEQRFPVILREFVINRGSGGKGMYHAGDGVRRTIEFLTTLKASILSGYRQHHPVGVNGGESGRRGKNKLKTANSKERYLEGCSEQTVHKGDQITIETPTGGGFGPKPT